MDPDFQESQQWPPRRRRHHRSGVNIGRSSVHWTTESIPDDHVMGINCRTILELIHTEECPPALFSLNALQPISTLADDQCRYQGPRSCSSFGITSTANHCGNKNEGPSSSRRASPREWTTSYIVLCAVKNALASEPRPPTKPRKAKRCKLGCENIYRNEVT